MSERRDMFGVIKGDFPLFAFKIWQTAYPTICGLRFGTVIARTYDSVV